MGTQLRIFESYLDEEDLELIRTTSEDNLVHDWGTSVDETWETSSTTISHSSTMIARSSRET